MLSSFYVITTGPTHAPTVGLIHLMPRTLWEFGPSSLKPNDEGSASKQSSSNSRPLSRQPLRRDSKSWFRYFTAWSLAPIPCAFSRLCWSFAAMPDMISDSWQEDGAGCRSPCAQVCVRVAVSVIWTHTDSVHTLSSGCLLSRFWHTCSHPALVARMQRTLRGTELEPYYYSGFYIRSRERIFKVSSDRVRVFTLEPECGTHF